MTDEETRNPRRTATARGTGKNQRGRTGKTNRSNFRPKRSIWRRLILAAVMTLVLVVICAGVGGMLAIYYYSQDLPPTSSLKDFRPNTVTYFYSDDGRVVGEFYTEHRIVVSLAKIPQHVRQAFIAAEDASFYTHPGFDIAGIIRAAIKNFESGETKQGASTIPQQVVSLLLLNKEKKYSRKIKEAILSYKITKNLSKDEVLYIYLNLVYMGHGAYGIESAAQLYFDKHVDQLTIGEAALLAGVLPAPSRYSPFVRPEAARTRQEYVVKEMVRNGFITEEQAKAGLAEKIKLYEDRPNYNTALTPYFTEHVRRVLEDKYGQERLYKDGLKVYTTVNIEDYAAAQKAVARGVREFDKRRNFAGPVKQLKPSEIEPFLKEQTQMIGAGPLNPNDEMEAVVTDVNAKASTLTVRVGSQTGTIRKKDLQWALKRYSLAKLLKPGDVVRVRLADPESRTAKSGDKENGLYYTLENDPMVQAALLSVDNRDGAVKAMIGGRDFKESQFNRAIQSARQPGSSFKPVIYAAAMDNGYTPGSIIIDSPIVYDDFAHGRRWKPTNFDQKFYGPTDLYTGLTQSRNVMAIKLLSKLGYPAVFDTARKLGITSELPQNLSLALGSQGISLPEMVTAFSAFANMGERVDPLFITRIVDRDGNVLEEFKPNRIRAISSGTACTINYMLQGVVDHGTGTRVKPLGRPVGGKTGTTNDLADAWFVGFTPEYTTGVWIGRDVMERMGYGESGGVAAAPIFLYYMQDALKDMPIQNFEVPPDAEIVNNGSANVCYKAGTVGTGISEAAPQASPDEEFLKFDLDEQDD